MVKKQKCKCKTQMVITDKGLNSQANLKSQVDWVCERAVQMRARQHGVILQIYPGTTLVKEKVEIWVSKNGVVERPAQGVLVASGGDQAQRARKNRVHKCQVMSHEPQLPQARKQRKRGSRVMPDATQPVQTKHQRKCKRSQPEQTKRGSCR